MRLGLFFCIIFLFSCNRKGSTSAEILSKPKMQAVLWDIMQADVYTNQIIRYDTTKNINLENVKLQKEIFAIHKISKESFYNSYAYYQAHPLELQAILDSMSVKKEKVDNTKFLRPNVKQ